jgi:hypothetical protein
MNRDKKGLNHESVDKEVKPEGKALVYRERFTGSLEGSSADV